MCIFNLKIGAPAGFGVMTTGPMLAKMIKRNGYYVFAYPEYPSLIRGGYNNYQICIADSAVYSTYKNYDLILALDSVVFKREVLTSETLVLVDKENVEIPDGLKCSFLSIPFKDMIKKEGLLPVVKNTIAVGAAAKLMGLDFNIVETVLKETYPAKVIDVNIKAAKVGFDFIQEQMFLSKFKKNNDIVDQIVISGNDSIACGAITAGMNFYSTYPMTPASSLLHTLASSAEEYGIIVKHAEDEISGVNMAIGAAYAGARAMTGTAGGGLSLMTEALGLAAMTETPLVVALAQRPGPATGVPTFTEQSDLQFVLNASHGEFVRIILTPGDVDELYSMTFDAFNLAERYQVPVFILTDKYLSESLTMTKPFDSEGLEIDRGFIFEGNSTYSMAMFQRYKEKENGVPVRSIPGTEGGLHKTPSNEHDTYGFVSDDPKVRKEQQDRRFSKVEHIVSEMSLPVLYGAENAEITFVCWGSLKMNLLEAMKHTDKFNFIHFNAVEPLDWTEVEAMFEGIEPILIENNFTGQLGRIIQEKTDINFSDMFLKYDGRPFFVEEILEYVNGGRS